MGSHSSGGVVIDAVDPLTAGALNAEIGSIMSIDIPSNVETVADDAGQIYDEGQAITQFAPVANVTTKSIAEVLSVIGVAGQCFIDGSGAPGVEVFGKNRGDCLTDVEANQHTRYLFPNGLLMLGTLQASKGSDATISFIVHGITDGTLSPMAIAHNQTLPASLIRGQWEVAICKIAGTVFKPEDVTLNFGQRETKRRPLAPLIWPETIAVEKVQPVATFRGLDIGLIGSAGIDVTGESATHANTVIQLVKRLTGASYEAAATTVHITFTMAGLVIVTNPFSASGQNDATVDVEVRGIHDGTNVPVLINIASAYDSTP
jgi:hypothetical protein